MFTGIIECLGKIESVTEEGTNKIFQIKSPISHALRIDQSVAHNGVCLTITKIENDCHWVTAIDETLLKTSLNTWKPKDEINLERCLKFGSWKYEIEFLNVQNYRTVAKGSITLNGTSLTVVDSEPGKFSVAIIPYTYEHTSIKHLKVGDPVNLECDIIGKWVKEWMN